MIYEKILFPFLMNVCSLLSDSGNFQKEKGFDNENMESLKRMLMDLFLILFPREALLPFSSF